MGRTIGRKMGRDGNNWSNRNFGGHPSKASPQYENCRRQNQGLEGSLSGRYYQMEGGRGPRPSFCGRDSDGGATDRHYSTIHSVAQSYVTKAFHLQAHCGNPGDINCRGSLPLSAPETDLSTPPHLSRSVAKALHPTRRRRRGGEGATFGYFPAYYVFRCHAAALSSCVSNRPSPFPKGVLAPDKYVVRGRRERGT